MAPTQNRGRALLAAAALAVTLPAASASASQPPESKPAATQPAATQPPAPQPPAEAVSPQRAPLPTPRAARYVQIVAREAAIIAAPGGEVVVRARRGTVLELKSTSSKGYEVILHSGQTRLLPQAAARPVLYRPLHVDDPTLRQQVLAAVVEAQSRAQQEAGRRARGEQARATLARLLADRYAFHVAQRYSLNPPVVRALAVADGIGEDGPDQ